MPLFERMGRLTQRGPPAARAGGWTSLLKLRARPGQVLRQNAGDLSWKIGLQSEKG